MRKVTLQIVKAFLFLLSVSLSVDSTAQEFRYELSGTPVDITGWTMGADAIIDGGSIRLTESVGNKTGYIYYNEPQDLSGECSYFTVEFEYKMNNASGLATPADGLAFWFLQDPPVGFVLGGGMGMPPILNGYALVMDVYNNDGVPDNPIITLDTYNSAPYTEGFFGNSVGAPLLNQTFVNDNTWRHCKLEYNSGVMSVYLDHNPVAVITGPIDLEGLVGYFGFSAATGGSYQEHFVRNVLIIGSEAPEPPAVTDTTFICQQEGIFTFDVDDFIPGANVYWYDDIAATTPLATAPTIDMNVPGAYTYYVSQARAGCPIESERAPVTALVTLVPNVTLETSSNLICTGGSVTLNATVSPADEEYIYRWLPVGSVDDPTDPSTTASPSISTTYSVIVHTGRPECADTAQALVTVIPNNITLVNDDVTVCEGTVVPLNVSGHPSLNYFWSPSSMAIDNPNVQNTFLVAGNSGKVYITASHPGCVDVTDSFTLTVEPIPVLNLGADIKLCMSDTAHLYAAVEPADYPDYKYTWTPGIKLSDSTIKNPIFTGYSDETYIVTVETPLGCMDTDTINVFVNASDFLVLAFNDTAVCFTDSVQLSATGGAQYKWTPSIGLSNDTIANPIAHLASSNQYIVEATNEFGCIDRDTVTVRHLPGPVITLADSVYVYPGESIEMDMVSNAHYFEWFPPEGLNNTTIANPLASPDVRTRYFVKASTEYGCTAIDSIDVIVNLESLFDVPNAFVPGNLSTNNGEFKIIKRGDVELLSFKIYNRWGNIVFETDDINKGWNGQYQDKSQPMGVYVYVIEAKLNTGRIIQLHGNVTLIR